MAVAALLLTFLTITGSSLLSSWFHFSVFPLPPVQAQFSSNPSTGWNLSDYYGNYNISEERYVLPSFTFGNQVVCINKSSNLELLNDAEGLYGRPTGLISAHAHMPYTLYFGLYFVTPAEDVCMKRINGSRREIPAYYLSLVALNAFGRSQDPNEGKVVWTANPEKPVTKKACLYFDDSNLKLVDHHSDINASEVVWQTSYNASNVSLAISFEGNVILFSNTTYKPLWESFRYPTDTLMVLQVLGEHNTLSVNSTLANYTMAIQNGSLVLFARIGQLLEGNELNSYGSSYWTFPYGYNTSNNDNTSFAALCWDSHNQLRLYFGSTRSPTEDFELGVVSPEFCSTIFNGNETAMPITDLNQSANATFATFATFLRLEADGDLHAYTVNDTTTAHPSSNATWREFYSVLKNTPCDLPLRCGFYGICVDDREKSKSNYCTCNYSEFQFVDKLNKSDVRLEGAEFESDTTSGCKFKSKNGSTAEFFWSRNRTGEANSSSGCGRDIDRTQEVEYVRMVNASYFDLSSKHAYEEDDGGAELNCIGKCHDDCNCTAAFWNESTSLCFLVRGQLGTIQIRRPGDMVAYIKYVKFANTNSMSRSPLSTWILSVVSALAALLLMACLFLICLHKRKRDSKRIELQKERSVVLSLLDGANTERFTWKQMHEYTCGFSDLLGSGGFGRVFRGSLPDGTAIAVKQLDETGRQGQGNKEFMAEVSILSRIHHANLVRLIGFCLEGIYRLLVYEYMENGSLDAWLFRSAAVVMQEAGSQDLQLLPMKEKGKRREVLPWKTRFKIALATAKGLAYLHEECQEKIIHMDMKPQNILLGRNFVAKISDFGMSRRTSREQSSVMTVMRGTPGYLAPEWLLDSAVTEKCDVYSFGIVLLEMVSGKRVREVVALKQKLWMRTLRESVMLDLLDEDLRRTEVEEKEAVRMVEVALLCVRTDPTKRPAMSKVAAMLEGKEEVVEDGGGEDDIEELRKTMVMYSSGMNKRMRMKQQQQQQHEYHGRSFAGGDASTSSGGGSNSNIWTSDMMSMWASDIMMSWSMAASTSTSSHYTKMIKKKKKKREASSTKFSQQDEDDYDTTEWDKLLQK